MRTLDRYIIRQFLINFVILTFVIMSLFVLVDGIVNIDEFVEAGRLRAQLHSDHHYVWLWTLYSLVDYYYPMTVLIYIFLSGLLVVAAAGFTLSGLSRTGELIGMVAGGISMYRIAAPLLAVGCLLNILTLPLQEYVVPLLANKLARGPGEARYDSKATFTIRLSPDRKENLFTAYEFDPSTEILHHLTVLMRNADGLVEQRITAEAAQWDENLPWPRSQERGGWRLVGGRSVTHQLGGYEAPAANRGEQEIGVFYTDLSPRKLLVRRAAIYPRLLSLVTLHRMSANASDDEKAVLERITHSRFSLALVNALILAMALPYFLLRAPANLAIKGAQAAAFSLVVWGAAVVIIQAGGQFQPTDWHLPAVFSDLLNHAGAALGNPVTAAWLPVVVFLPLAAYRLQRIET